jgi:hypothetical protein
MLLDTARWSIIKLACHKHHGVQLRSAAFRLLTALLLDIEEAEWARNQRLVAWPTLKRIQKVAGLGEGSIAAARAQLIACGLIVPLSGAHKRGGADPIAAYQIHLQPVRSPLQEEAARHVARLQHRGKEWSARRRAQLDARQRAAVLDELLQRLNGG